MLLSLGPNAAAQTTFSFADIKFWVGIGANRAAMAIDWVEDATEPSALVWGFRWQETATGADMLTAIVAADDRLFAKLGSSGLGSELYGLGYDVDVDGQFAINDGTQFNDEGLAMGSRPFNPATSVDPDDYYAEGWFEGFWHYGNASVSPFNGGTWIDSLAAFNARQLSDGDWDSWAFSPTFNFGANAENPIAAPSPYPPGDYNRDERVDATDYAVWKSEYGSTTNPAVDGNLDGRVDAGDYVVWRNNLGTGVPTTGHGVPEPQSLCLAVCFACVLAILRRW